MFKFGLKIIVMILTLYYNIWNLHSKTLLFSFSAFLHWSAIKKLLKYFWFVEINQSIVPALLQTSPLEP